MPHVGGEGRAADDEGYFAMPVSIKRFSQLYLASIALSAINSVLTFGHQRDVLARNPQTAGLGDGFLIASVVFGAVVAIVLWYFVVNRASTIAKWILVLLTGLGLLWAPSSLRVAERMGTAYLAMFVLILILQVAAVAFLFAPDARAWLGRRHAADDLADGESPAP